MASPGSPKALPAAPGPDRATVAAFLLLVFVGGCNGVAVRLSNSTLPPFWAAGLRFAATAVLFWALVAALRIPLPRGRAQRGALIFGLLNNAVSYGFAYWGLVRIQAGLGMAILATVPLLAVFLAWAHRQETFGLRGILGALVSAAGLWIGVSGETGSAVHLPSVAILLTSAVFMAEATVLLKRFPPSHPLVANALATSIAVPVLLAMSRLAGEPWSLPAGARAWTVFAYLVTVGTVGLFYLYLWVLRRWTASATAYSNLLMPVATAVIASWLVHEPITRSFVLGGALLLIGVWLGALQR